MASTDNDIVLYGDLKEDFKAFDKYRKLNLLGKANGIATLGNDGRLLPSQLPVNAERLITSFIDEYARQALKSGDYVYYTYNESKRVVLHNGRAFKVENFKITEFQEKTAGFSISDFNAVKRENTFYGYFSGKFYVIESPMLFAETQAGNNNFVPLSEPVNITPLEGEMVYTLTPMQVRAKVIYDGSSYIVLDADSNVQSVNGEVGHVTLSARDIPYSEITGDVIYIQDGVNVPTDSKLIAHNVREAIAKIESTKVASINGVLPQRTESNNIDIYVNGSGTSYPHKEVIDGKSVVTGTDIYFDSIFALKHSHRPPEIKAWTTDGSTSIIGLTSYKTGSDGTDDISAYLIVEGSTGKVTVRNTDEVSGGDITVASRSWVKSNTVMVEFVDSLPANPDPTKFYIVK